MAGLLHASAADEAAFRRAFFVPSTPQLPDVRAELRGELPASAPVHRARRIWAAARGRPLRIALDRHRDRHRRALARAGRHMVAERAPVQIPLVPIPSKPALVSIYADPTLRTGDAVMLGDGIHIFRNDGAWPLRPANFVPLQRFAGLDWHLRATLTPYDKNPPTRWSAIMEPPA